MFCACHKQHHLLLLGPPESILLAEFYCLAHFVFRACVPDEHGFSRNDLMIAVVRGIFSFTIHTPRHAIVLDRACVMQGKTNQLRQHEVRIEGKKTQKTV